MSSPKYPSVFFSLIILLFSLCSGPVSADSVEAPTIKELAEKDKAKEEVIKKLVEALEVREDNPISRLRTTITNQDGQVVLDGTALVYTEPLQ